MSDLRSRATPIDAIDSIEIISPMECTATKLIRAEDPYLEGHYPGNPIYPGIFIIESVHEAMCRLVAETRGKSVFADLATVTSVRFMLPCTPGDTLQIHLTCQERADGMLTVKAVGRKGDAKSAQMTLAYRLIDDPVEGTDA